MTFAARTLSTTVDVPRPRPRGELSYPPDGTPWTGQIAGVYRRNSSAIQANNDSALYQIQLMRRLHAKGIAAAFYDEQSTSATKGFERGGQPTAQIMLEDLEHGALDMLAVASLDRITREYSGADAASIKRSLWNARAALWTPEREYQIWNLTDEQAYDLGTRISAWDAKSRRNNTYRGIIAAIQDRPIFRHRVTIGYAFEYQRAHTPACDQTAPCMCPIALDAAGRAVQRWWVKNPDDAPILAEFERACDLYRNRADLINHLNETARPARWIATGKRWNTQQLSMVLQHPVYGGKWIAVRHPSEQTDVWAQYLDSYGNVADIVHDVPHLAYWSLGQIARWRETFLAENAPARRHRTHDHPFMGVLQCSTCGLLMQSAGRDGYRCPDTKRYNLPTRRTVQCPDPQQLARTAATRAFLDHLPIAIAELRADADRIALNASAAPLLDELRNVNEQMTRLRSDWLGMHMPREERIRLSELDLDRTRLEARIEQTTDRRTLSDNARQLITLAADNPRALRTWQTDAPDREQRIAELVCVLYKSARVERHGASGRWAHFRVTDYELAPLEL